MMEAAKLKLVPNPVGDNFQCVHGRSDKGAYLIPLELILVSLSDNIRSEYDSESISKLGHQLLSQGQLQSILVEPLPEPGPKGERFALVAGYRRYFAAKEVGIPALIAIVRDFEDKSAALAANAAENIEREQVSLFDIIRRIRDLLAQEWTVERIVSETGADPILTPQLVFILQECAPELVDQLRYDESSKTISRLEWAAKNITGITKEQKFKRQVEWWKERTQEGWRTLKPKKKGRPRSAAHDKVYEVAERIRAARGLQGPTGWVSLTLQQAEAVAEALLWSTNPKAKPPI